MSAVSMQFRSAVLPWNNSAAEETQFRRILTAVLLFCTIFSVAMRWLPRPQAEASKTEELPPRYAKLLLEQQPAPPEPAKPIEPPTPPKTAEGRKPEIAKPQNAKIDAARRKAAGVGLLALSKELSALADTSSLNSSIAAKRLNTAPGHAAAAAVDTGILTSDTGKKSVSVKQQSHVATAGSTTLDDNQQRIAQKLLDAKGGSATIEGATGKGRGKGVSRGDEEVAIVMDQHKSALYSLYDRARRANPGLKGKIVLIITILPSGKVSNVIIKSSELNAPELEASLVARVRQFDFGPRQGGPRTIKVPVEFLPS